MKYEELKRKMDLIESTERQAKEYENAIKVIGDIVGTDGLNKKGFDRFHEHVIKLIEIMGAANKMKEEL